MARPQKIGIDYFPLDVVLDDNVRLIEAEHGIEGFGILIKMYQKIYSEGYYYSWTEKQQLLFSNYISVNRNTVTSIVSDCLKWGIFNQELYDKYHILTSRGIQKRYVAAIYKRSEIEMIKEYLLIDVNDKPNITIVEAFDDENTDASGVSDRRNSPATEISDGKSTQSKVKKSKVNNIKDIIPFSDIIDHLNHACGTQFKTTTKATRRHIEARWREGFRLNDFLSVIDSKVVQWLQDPKMSQYLRPETLFGTKFEGYLVQGGGKKYGTHKPSKYESILNREIPEPEYDPTIF